jgi:hypothetical protein
VLCVGDVDKRQLTLIPLQSRNDLRELCIIAHYDRILDECRVCYGIPQARQPLNSQFSGEIVISCILARKNAWAEKEDSGKGQYQEKYD